MIADTPTVHTTGVNWQSISIILGSFATVAIALGGLLAWSVRRVEQSRARTEAFVTTKVGEVAATLADRLGDINDHLRRQDDKIDDTRDKIMSLSGRIRRKLW